MVSLSSTCIFIGGMAFIPTDAFIQNSGMQPMIFHRSTSSSQLFISTNNNEKNPEESDVPTSNNSNQTDTVHIDELNWRLAKLRLEESYTKRILSRKPIKLPYEQSRKWIQRNWNPKTKEEFEDLVLNGNLRTPYISKRPEEYYGERGEWVSWEHYLLGSLEDDIGCANSTDGKQELTKWQ
eukprot:g5614.t1 g5614   contig2:913544-914167(+)